jgi:hypothetical protein
MKSPDFNQSEEISNSKKIEFTKKQKIIASLSGIAILIALGTGFYFKKSSPKIQPTGGEQTTQDESPVDDQSTPESSSSKSAKFYVDPGTGETIVTVPGKTPENTDGHNITMLGFASLVNDYGMTLEQVKKLQSEFEDYSSHRNKPFHELSINLKEVETTIDSDEGTSELELPITLDRSEKETAKVEYFGIDDPELTIYDSSNNKVYSSDKN